MKYFYLILFLLLPTASLAAPDVTGLNGVRVDGGSLVVTGTGFGANGPNIVVFDNFESGTNGELINIGAGSATVGKWDELHFDYGNGNLPRYNNVYSVSGSKAKISDFTAQNGAGWDAGSSVKVNNIDTGDVFLSYWVYLPATSVWPCVNGVFCNWKMAWVYGLNSGDDDQVLPVGLPPDNPNTEPFNNWAISCNGCYELSVSWFAFDMYKGNWYRFTSWVHATNDGTSERDLWIMSPDDSIAVTQKVNWTGQIFENAEDMFETFSLDGWARWCNDCDESAPRFDDVYLATGANARARVEIGNASTYAASTNLSIATVTAWADTEITTTIREGSLGGVVGKYLYVVHSDGTINADGYLIAAAEVIGTEGRSLSSGTLDELGW